MLHLYSSVLKGTKRARNKLEQKINNSIEIATPKTFFQEAKLHKTHVTTTVNMVYYKKSDQLNTATNII